MICFITNHNYLNCFYRKELIHAIQSKTDDEISTSNEQILLSNANRDLLDPLKLPNSRKLEHNELVFKKSQEDMKVIGYVKTRPLMHASHWKNQLETYLISIIGLSLDKLRKSITLLNRACSSKLTPEESICALADTGGSVGEVVEKLKDLNFYKELQLVCRCLHVQNIVITHIQGGERIFNLPGTSSTTTTLKPTKRSSMNLLDYVSTANGMELDTDTGEDSMQDIPRHLPHIINTQNQQSKPDSVKMIRKSMKFSPHGTNYIL